MHNLQISLGIYIHLLHARGGKVMHVVLHSNCMFHRRSARRSMPLSFSLATLLPRRGGDAFSWDHTHVCATPHPSLTAWTTRVSNPFRSPRFRGMASVRRLAGAFAFGVLTHIYPFYRSLSCSPAHTSTPVCFLWLIRPRPIEGNI